MIDFKRTSLAAAVSVAVLASACDSAGPELTNAGRISVSIQLDAAAAKTATGPIEIEGSNGTLSITDIRFILDGVALEVQSAESEGPEIIEIDPVFVDVPLDLSELELLVAQVPLGSYSGLQFAIDNVAADDDDDDPDADAAMADEIREVFADWPDAASVVFVGMFEPNDGSDARPFTIYVGAKITVDLVLDPPVHLTEEHVEKALKIVMNPLDWIPDWVPEYEGPVFDPSPYDYGNTGDVIPFVLSIADGFEVCYDEHCHVLDHD